MEESNRRRLAQAFEIEWSARHQRDPVQYPSRAANPSVWQREYDHIWSEILSVWSPSDEWEDDVFEIYLNDWTSQHPLPPVNNRIAQPPVNIRNDSKAETDPDQPGMPVSRSSDVAAPQSRPNFLSQSSTSALAVSQSSVQTIHPTLQTNQDRNSSKPVPQPPVSESLQSSSSVQTIPLPTSALRRAPPTSSFQLSKSTDDNTTNNTTATPHHPMDFEEPPPLESSVMSTSNFPDVKIKTEVPIKFEAEDEREAYLAAGPNLPSNVPKPASQKFSDSAFLTSTTTSVDHSTLGISTTIAHVPPPLDFKPFFSQRSVFDFEPGVHFHLSSVTNMLNGELIPPEITVEKFDDGSGAMTDDHILIWLGRTQEHLDPRIDLMDQLKALVKIGPIHQSSELNHQFPNHVVSMARLGGLTRTSVAIRLTRPITRFKYDHKLMLYPLRNYEVFSTREWVSYVKPFPIPGLDDPVRLIPCMFMFSTYRSCKLQHCAFSHDINQLGRLRNVRKVCVDEARKTGEDIVTVAMKVSKQLKLYSLKVAKQAEQDKKAQQQQQQQQQQSNSSSSIVTNSTMTNNSQSSISTSTSHTASSTEAAQDAESDIVFRAVEGSIDSSSKSTVAVSTTSSSSTSFPSTSSSSFQTNPPPPDAVVPIPATAAAHVPRSKNIAQSTANELGVSVGTATSAVPMHSLDETTYQRLLDWCVIAPPSTSAIAWFDSPHDAPLFALPAFKSLHAKLKQDDFDKYFTVCRRRRIQWVGCPMEVKPEGPNRWRIPDANKIWQRLMQLLGDVPNPTAKSAAADLVFVNRSVDSQHVVFHFKSERSARTLVEEVCRINPRMGGLFQCMGRPTPHNDPPLPPLPLKLVPISIQPSKSMLHVGNSSDSAIDLTDTTSHPSTTAPSLHTHDSTQYVGASDPDQPGAPDIRTRHRSRSRSPRRSARRSSRSRSRSRSKERVERERATLSKQQEQPSSYSSASILTVPVSTESSSSRTSKHEPSAQMPDLYPSYYFPPGTPEFDKGERVSPVHADALAREHDPELIIEIQGFPLIHVLNNDDGVRNDAKRIEDLMVNEFGVGWTDFVFIARTKIRLQQSTALRAYVGLRDTEASQKVIRQIKQDRLTRKDSPYTFRQVGGEDQPLPSLYQAYRFAPLQLGTSEASFDYGKRCSAEDTERLARTHPPFFIIEVQGCLSVDPLNNDDGVKNDARRIADLIKRTFFDIGCANFEFIARTKERLKQSGPLRAYVGLRDTAASRRMITQIQEENTQGAGGETFRQWSQHSPFASPSSLSSSYAPMIPLMANSAVSLEQQQLQLQQQQQHWMNYQQALEMHYPNGFPPLNWLMFPPPFQPFGGLFPPPATLPPSYGPGNYIQIHGSSGVEGHSQPSSSSSTTTSNSSSSNSFPSTSFSSVSSSSIPTVPLSSASSHSADSRYPLAEEFLRTVDRTSLPPKHPSDTTMTSFDSTSTVPHSFASSSSSSTSNPPKPQSPSASRKRKMLETDSPELDS